MFDLDSNNNVVIKDPGVLMIKEFKEIWDKDTSKQKVNSLKIFSYIYFKNDFKSPYRNRYTEEELPSVLDRDLSLGKDWKITKEIEEAESKYADLQTTKSLKLLLSAEKALDQITKYFDNFKVDDIKDVEDKANAISKLMGNIKGVDEVVGKLEVAKERVTKELSTKKLSGTKVLSSRELPKSKRK